MTDFRPTDDVAEPVLLRQLLTATEDIVFIKDIHGFYLADNEAHSDLIGVAPGEAIGKHDSDLHSPDVVRQIRQTDDRVISTGQPHQETGLPIEFRGEFRYFDIVKSPMRNSEGDIIGIIGVARDITRLYEAEADLLNQNRYLESFNSMVLGVLHSSAGRLPLDDFLDAGAAMVNAHSGAIHLVERHKSAPTSVALRGEVADLDRLAAEAFGRGASVALNRSGAMQNVDPTSVDTMALSIRVSTTDGFAGTIGFSRNDGPFSAEQVAHAHTVAGHLSLALNQQRQAEQNHHRAMHDQLTGLPNRYLFEEIFLSAIESARDEGRKLAVFFVDLDHFKRVNDIHGHAAGDRLLMQVAERMAAAMTTRRTLARIGGDEFAIVATNFDDGGPLDVVERLKAITADRFQLSPALSINVNLSVGYAVFPDDGLTARDLLHAADQAMYRHKRGRR